MSERRPERWRRSRGVRLVAGVLAVGGMRAAVTAGTGTLAAAAAERPVSGRAVMEEADRKHRTAGQYSEGYVLVEEKGRQRRKSWRAWRLGWGGDAKGLIQFLEPPEVKGVGLLTLAHRGQPDEQWFYTPAIDRDRRIARQEKTTRFLGTHYTYEDMEERDLEDYDYTLLDGATLDGAACHRVEAVPRPGTESQYSSLVLWVRKDSATAVQVETFVQGAARRTFRGSDVRESDGIATVHRWVVTDTRRPGRTTLELRNVLHRSSIPPGIFSLQALRVIQPPPAAEER